MKLWSSILHWLFPPKPVAPVIPIKPDVPPPPAAEVPPPIAVPPSQSLEYKELSEYDLIVWAGRAADISQSFEGSDPWANITGNFDGTGLTCGSLGWTIQWMNQQRLVKAFVTKHGVDRAKSLMPKTWDWYWKLTTMTNEDQAIPYADSISHGTSRIDEPYRFELRAFWKSIEMTQLQKEFAVIDFGRFAIKQAYKCQKYFGLEYPKFHHFAYWFDQAVLNGSGKTPEIEMNEGMKTSEVFSWMEKETGYCQDDFDQNKELWKGEMVTATKQQIVLFELAMVRSKESRGQFDTVTMNRRGTLALGKGWVNGELRNLKGILGL